MSTDSYVAAIQTSRPGFLPALLELQRLGACARCCLRFAGVRTCEYAEPAPTVSQICLAMQQTAAGITQAAETVRTAVTGCDSGMTSPPQQEAGRQGQPTANESQSVAAEGTVCRVCLGILQSLDGPVEAVPARLLEAIPATDGAGACWHPLSQGDVGSIAKYVRSLGYANDSLAVEISIPASAQLRQLAMWYHLRTTAATAHLFCGETLRDDVVDLKECLRLRPVVAEPLAGCLELPLDAQDGDLRMTLNYIHPGTASESDFLFGRPCGNRTQKRKRQRMPNNINVGRSSSVNVVTMAAKWAKDKFRSECAVPPEPVKQATYLLVACRRVALYIGGCYRKLERDVSQSPWTIDGQKKGRTSIQEEIEKVLLPPLRCDGAKFITAGREDIDVRMLGDGRPFVMEIQNQRAAMPPAQCFANMEKRLAESAIGVEVRKLQPVGKEKLQLIKDGEQHKRKSYEAVCSLPCDVTAEVVEKINSCKNLLLAQKTPTRVAHRRALLVRERMVYCMHCTPDPQDARKLVLNLEAQAGTYIKEFVHGDEGRTNPSLGTFLGCSEPVKIEQLDVLQIHLEFL